MSWEEPQDIKVYLNSPPMKYQSKHIAEMEVKSLTIRNPETRRTLAVSTTFRKESRYPRTRSWLGLGACLEGKENLPPRRHSILEPSSP
jgi:hypothetical protein